MTSTYRPVKCTRCRFEHAEGDRISRPRPRRSTSEIQMDDLVCPRCGGKAFYDMTPQVAWCWASGLIEIGDVMPADKPGGGGAILIATGPKCSLRLGISVVARHGRGDGDRQLLVPGVPEASNQREAADALGRWLDWCRGRKTRDRVIFAKGPQEVSP